jgi:hypothetical protein
MANNTMTTTTIAEGDFKSLKLSDLDCEMLEDAYQAVTKANRWSFLRRPDVPGDNGFMFSEWPQMKDIDAHMEYGGHSGASYGMTMRQMEFIAKKGWDAYVESVKEQQRKEAERKRKEEERKPKERAYYRPVNDVENHPIYMMQQAPSFPPEAPTVQNLMNTATVIDRAINQAVQQGAMDPLSFAQNLQANPEVRRVIPDIDDQAAAMKRFAEGKMSYAEMRGLCG